MNFFSSDYKHAADEMVAEQIYARNIRDPQILEAFRQIPRQLFVDVSQKKLAYSDQPLPIGFGQTISQPYVVAYMIDAMQIDKSAWVLEVGTGSGYETAILARLAGNVFTVERISELSLRAQEVIAQIGLSNIEFRIGDGCLGWQEKAPFSHIVVTAASPEIPTALIDQLALGGKLLIPLGSAGGGQELTLIEKTPLGLKSQKILPVRFVPLIWNSASEKHSSKK
ncbi:MAG: protein-L-isoaspartate(D-aspartate) O-methyltransferase [Candidatus Marinimicrobia bacterium]|jgi:protein-L-isoaspartate(D-aspartate) O-methyltransferase|nr:protein-L-isoaspartate(D-aspartate) O-methyltransferase [Candidatus Neomarinimicrobiota bacterium]MCK9483614.1 protein-L-isoaspartate(D-aspartate) O-methyltransferase [Candidatus Neomarinimicrobiota bacterium]MCK9560477.1 protein-L-isoaspartate(D-aspartate) O-methyltransferase [Candidatus Neomarinimicrobiota bacterium]MDD5061220.1 protein-L-isoaspartate(D-aspartate) O-methyltransferase [Candidatus Neomarinimicrobiota bacterium]MDD5230369.1 protein-L-isoaspartate(D-aspartate) O-methyltransfer